jgi:hypothetical protein
MDKNIKLSENEQIVFDWISKNFFIVSSINFRNNACSLKNVVLHETAVYLTQDVFIDLMELAGFRTKMKLLNYTPQYFFNVLKYFIPEQKII